MNYTPTLMHQLRHHSNNKPLPLLRQRPNSHLEGVSDRAGWYLPRSTSFAATAPVLMCRFCYHQIVIIKRVHQNTESYLSETTLETRAVALIDLSD